MRISFHSIAAAVILIFAQLEGAVAQELDPWGGFRSAEASESEAVAPPATSGEEAADDADITGSVQPVANEAPVDTTDPLADIAAAPLRRTSPEIGPYDALGIRAGSFILYPSLETTVGYSTNATGSAGGAESGFGSVTPELRIQSDWARHETTLTLRGSYEDFTEDSIDEQPTASVEGTARLDLAEGWEANLAAGYNYTTQSVSDPNFPAGVDQPPGVHGLTSSAELRGGMGRNVFEFETDLSRTIYEDGTSGGAEVDQGDRTNTEIGGRLRYGFAVSPVLMPFVEGEAARRIYDRKVDNGGIERSAWIYGIRGGIAYRSDPVLSGEVAVGYAIADVDDPALSSIEALTFDGSLVWSPTELTTVTFSGSTEVNPGTDPSSSGSVLYAAAVDVAYLCRENVTIDALANVSHERFEGTGQEDTTYQLGLGATWRLNRSVHLTGGYIHEWLDSSDSTRDYQSDSVRLTLRLQR
jgi:hypothetical protein